MITVAMRMGGYAVLVNGHVEEWYRDLWDLIDGLETIATRMEP